MVFSFGLRIGKYEVQNKLGQGGYGIVYSARDTELGRDVALKFLKPEYVARPQVVQRFLQEARAVAKIVHPGIVTVYECGHVENTNTIADGTVYIAMELLSGDSLSSRLQDRDGKPLPLDTVVELGTQMASALEAAHKKGIVHRDLKPDNVFLVPDAAVDGGERLKILDFGVAKLSDQHTGRVSTNTEGATGVHTHSMMMLGTPRYMSPEQCKSSARVDHRSDIYSLGCILYELLAGKSPYDGDAGELIAKHQLAPIPRVRSARPEISAYVDVLISSMLAKEPSDRPGSMVRVREALLASRDTPDADPLPAEAIDTTMRGSAGETSDRSNRTRIWWLAGMASMIPIGLALGYLLAHSAKTPPPPVAQHEPIAIADAAVSLADAGEDPARRELACRRLASERKWDEVLGCADELAKLVPPGSPVLRELTTISVIETRNADCFAKLETAAASGDLRESQRWLDRIDDESIYKDEGNELVDKLAQATQPAGPSKRPSCDADSFSKRAQQAITEGQYHAALALLEASIRCRPDPSLYRLAVLAACNSSNEAKARRYFARLPANHKNTMAQLCLRNGIGKLQ
jgi:serine/threonine protein kinase